MDSDSEDEAAAAGGAAASADALNEDLALINALTGAPLEDDSLLYVVPVCGPYAIMNNFKFKVKLTPGNSVIHSEIHRQVAPNGQQFPCPA